MSTSSNMNWDDADKQAPGWRIERRSIVRTPDMAFFPDQNGTAYEKLLHNLPVMVHAMDGSGRMISANKHWLTTFGYQAADVVGRPFSEFLPSESRSKLVTSIYPRYLVAGEIRNDEILMFRKDGSLATVLLSMAAHRGEKGRLERTICILDDISERKLAEMTSNRSDQRFKGAFNASIHGMAIVSPTGRIELCNSAMKAFLRRDDLETAVNSFDELISTADKGTFLNGMSQLLRGDISALQQELKYVRPDKQEAYGATSVFLVKSESGDIEQLIVQVSDITDRKLIADRLYKTQKMEAIGQLTGGLAHDFNNMLTSVIGNLELADGKVADDWVAKRVKDALTAANHGTKVTRQLLSFARRQQLDPQDVSVNDLVKSVQPLMSRTMGEAIELSVLTMTGEPRSLIDPTQLENAIVSLCINARDAMPKGGRLTIETQPVHLDQAYADKNPDVVPGHYVMVAVTDTGIGMTPEVLESVFQPFYTTKPEGSGSGLGLSMVYGFIKQSGGHISIYSEPGHGTSVKMYLPRRMDGAARATPEAANPESVPAAPAATNHLSQSMLGSHSNMVEEIPAAQAEPAPAPAARPTILVVEDQEAVRAVACGFLEDFGYIVLEAGDGFEALSKLQENPEIDLMFSDVVMPGGMNGFDLAQAAQTLRPDLKVVHTSGYPKGAMVHQDEPRFKEGFIIMKPYRREDLQKIIKDALESQ
jgi:PAS domain S-box-containing protein